MGSIKDQFSSLKPSKVVQTRLEGTFGIVFSLMSTNIVVIDVNQLCGHWSQLVCKLESPVYMLVLGKRNWYPVYKLVLTGELALETAGIMEMSIGEWYVGSVLYEEKIDRECAQPGYMSGWSFVFSNSEVILVQYQKNRV